MRNHSGSFAFHFRENAFLLWHAIFPAADFWISVSGNKKTLPVLPEGAKGSKSIQKINQRQGTIGKLVNDQEFYKNAKLSLQKLDKVADGLEDQGPITVVGMLMNNLF